jgi:PAS domain S-box-containing protein
VENRVRHKNGRYVWLGTTARTVRGDDGRPAGVVTVSRDISDRKRTEMELARHKAGLEVLVAERTTQLTRRNLELENLFRIVQAARESSKLDDFFGVVHESLAGLVPAVNFFIGLYDREANRITFPYFVDEKDDRFEIVSVTDSGSLSAEVIKTRFPLRLGAQDLSARYPKERRPWGTVSQSWLGVPLIMGGEPIGVMGVQDYDRPDLYTDDDVRTLVLFSQPIAMAIERIRADQALRDNEERFRFLSEASNEAIFLSREGVVFEANQAAERMFGYTWEKLAGLSFLLLVSPEDRLMLPEIGNTERAEPYQVMALSRDGRLFPVEIKSQMAPYKNGRIRVTAIRDLTRQKEAEAELLEYQERLRRLGSEQVLAEERERRRIAADLHDHIGGSLALLKMRISALYKKTRSNSLRAMLEEFMAQADLVIQATRSLTVQLSPPMLHEMGLGPALEWLAESLAADHQIRVEFDASEPGPELREDLLILLYRSTRELVLNAIKHAEAADIKIRLVWSPDWVFIEVKDDGRGFDSPSLGLLFDWTLGFGLFSVQERLSAMGGRLEISSLPGRGTRATILAPRK